MRWTIAINNYETRIIDIWDQGALKSMHDFFGLFSLFHFIHYSVLNFVLQNNCVKHKLRKMVKFRHLPAGGNGATLTSQTLTPWS